jgi:hypothetical protein
MSNHLFIGVNQPSFYPGKNCDGIVVFVVNTPLNIAKIGVDIVGEEFICWDQGLTTTEVYSQRNQILSHNIELWPNGGEDKVLDVGVYNFKFSFELPTKPYPLNYEEENVGATTFSDSFIFTENNFLPITFGNERSYIRYLAKAFVEVIPEPVEGKETVNVKFEKVAPIKIVEQFDVESLIQPPKIVQMEKSFLFGGNPIKCELYVANGGVLFVGQKLFIHVNIKNQSSRNINGLFLRIEQYISLKGRNIQQEEKIIDRKETSVNALVENSAITGGQTYSQDLVLEIPSHVPGTISHSQFLSRRYELNLDIGLSITGSMTLSVPLTLLEWSPQLKGVVPDVVPIKVRPHTEEKKDNEKKENNDLK